MENGENFLDILKKVKELGFDGVEFAGFHGYDAETLKKTLDELGLVTVGAHMNLDTETALTHVIDIMGNAEKEAEKVGMKVYFHNHTREFSEPLYNTVPGTIFDRIKEVCFMQIDTYWSFHAGKDNYKLITENRDRIVHLHIKDGLDGTPKALGEGNNDLDAVVRAARDNGIEWLILENDDPEPDGLSDIARSMVWLNAHAR